MDLLYHEITLLLHPCYKYSQNCKSMQLNHFDVKLIHRQCYERQLIISGGDEAVFCKTLTVSLRNILFSRFKSLISSVDYVDESPRQHRKIPRCYRFSRCNARLSGFKDACKQLNRISFNLSMTNRRFTGSDGVGGDLTWQSGRRGGRRKREGGKGQK